MEEPQSLDGELAQAVFAQMMRDGILPASTVETVLRGFSEEAERAEGSYRRDRAEVLSRMALEVLIAGTGPTASDWHAERARKEIRERTAYLARKTDGGKDAT